MLIVTAVAHYLNGGIRLQSPFQRVTPQVKAHLSVILALMALVKTAQYYLARFELTFSHRGFVDGASYTDVKAQLPALNLLIFISIAAAALFIWNIWRRGWVLPIIAVGLWGFVSLVVGTIYPGGHPALRRAAERVRARSSRTSSATSRRRAPRSASTTSIDDAGLRLRRPNLDAGRRRAQRRRRSTTSGSGTRRDPADVPDAAGALQTFYRFDDVDVDRYDDRRPDDTPTMIALRELNADEHPERSRG